MSMNAPPLVPGVADFSEAPSAQPRFHRFHVGDMECVALSDGAIPFPGPPGRPTPAPAAPMLVPLACLLVRLPGTGLVLMDTGFGEGTAVVRDPSRSVGRLHASLASASIAPGDIDAVIISHIHPDHVGGMFQDDGAQTYPNATYHVGAEELAFWRREPPDLSPVASPPPAKVRMADAAKRMIALAGDRLQVFNAGEEVVPGIGTILLPGHSPGQIGFILSSGSEKLLYTADAVCEPAASIETPDAYNPMDMYPDLAVETRHKLIALLSAPPWQFFTPHFPWPNLGRLLSKDGHAVWAPALER